MKPINVVFLLALYKKHYPKEYAASVAAHGEPKPPAQELPLEKPRNPEKVARAKRKIAAEIGKDRKDG